MQNDRHQHRLLRQEGYRRIEVITGQRRRRQWSDEEKALIVSESFAPGANVSAVARRHGMSCGLLHKLRGKARQAAAATAPFIPIALADGGGSGVDDAALAASCGAIEIDNQANVALGRIAERMSAAVMRFAKIRVYGQARAGAFNSDHIALHGSQGLADGELDTQ